ncbi:MAG TPA: NAD(P)/FAD-dependent oxidoreductase [Acidilobales archaeon]|nr:NAD(P)/FAD-dependent oxidoreductase [Acidilobales archaeon]
MPHDVIVVGSGPAGSHAAKLLAEKGFKVLVLERAKHPRRKVCAGGIGYRMIKKYKVHLVNGLLEGALPIKSALFISPSGKQVRIDFKEALVYDLRRDIFDARLAQLAVNSGAELKEKVLVKGVKVEGDKVKVIDVKGVVYTSNVVIGADGINTRVGQSLGLIPKNWFEDNAFCPVSYIPAPPPKEDEPGHEFYLGLEGAGYAWVFRHSDHMNVGIGALRKNYSKLPKYSLIDFIKNHPIASKRINREPGPIYGHYIPYNGILKKLYTDRVLLIGDAGGFVNTLTGEGISHAFGTAEHAVSVIEEAFNSEDYSEKTMSKYQTLVENDPDLGVELKLGRILRKLMFKDLKFLDQLIEVASDNKTLQELLIDMIYVRKSYPEIIGDLVKKVPLSLNLKLFTIAPGDTLALLLKKGDPYFQCKG